MSSYPDRKTIYRCRDVSPRPRGGFLLGGRVEVEEVDPIRGKAQFLGGLGLASNTTRCHVRVGVGVGMSAAACRNSHSASLQKKKSVAASLLSHWLLSAHAPPPCCFSVLSTYGTLCVCVGASVGGE